MPTQGNIRSTPNPDRWPAETQSDLLWLTESEGKSLIPANARVGDRSEVAQPIQKRFCSTIGLIRAAS